MGRKRKEPVAPKDDQEYSFDLDCIEFFSGLDFEQRLALQKRMVEAAENKKCMPLSFAKKVAKEMGIKPLVQKKDSDSREGNT
jgi:hypothetical protein